MLSEGGQVTGLKTWKVLSIFDEVGRFAPPTFDGSDEQIRAGELVVEAARQASDVELFAFEHKEALDWNRGRRKVDDAGRTSESWLLAAGERVRGPDMVSAAADAHGWPRTSINPLR